MKPTYQPDLRRLDDGSYEQRFTVGYVAVEGIDDSILFGFTEEKYKSIHSVIITTPRADPFTPEDVYVEFNDQGNGCSGEAVALTLTPATFEIEYLDAKEATTGRVSYEARADWLSDPEENYSFPLRRVIVQVKLEGEWLSRVKEQLERMARAGVRVSITV